MKQDKFDKPGPLMERTRQLLNDSGKSLLDIFSETGLSFYWLRKFKQGEFVNPSVNRVEFLYEYLTGKPLGLK